METIQFPKGEEKILVTDLGLNYPGVEMYVWDDPSQPVCTDLLMTLVRHKQELDEATIGKFFQAVTRYVIRSNIDGLKFDTVEDTIASFQHPDLPWGYMYEFITLAVGKLLDDNEKLKKALEALSSNLDSGLDKSNGESESKNP
jgi:hypothetical protein